MRSLQSRLTLGLALSLLLLLGGQWLAVGWSIRQLVESYVAARIDHDVEALLVALTFDPAGRPLLDAPQLNAVYQQPYSGHYYAVATGAATVRSRSLWDVPFEVVPQPPGSTALTETAGPRGQRLLVESRGFDKFGHPVTIAVAEDLAPLDGDVGALRNRAGLLFLAAMVALLALQRLAVQRALRPLERARQELARLEEGEIGRLDEATPLEVRPLVDQINRLVALTAQRLQRSRNALGNLAHALKTPLTLLGQLADSPDAPAAWRDELRRHTATLRSLVERELKRARLAGGGGGPRLDLAAGIAPLLDTLRRIYRHKALAIDSRIPAGAGYPIDREDLLELLGNLLDNACKWAAGRVVVTAESRDGLLLRVEDDGPGCAPEELERLTERGTRLDEATAGHGLGLAIVREMVRDYGGELRLGRSEELGGLAVEVRLPRG